MDTSVAAVTVNVVLPEIAPNVAVIVVMPVNSEEASPLEPAALLILAIVRTEEVQVTTDVRSCVVKFAYTPVAMNC